MQLLYSVPISGTDGPPVFLENVGIDSTTKDLLFITTVYGVTAIDAADGAPAWTQSPTSYEYSVGSSPAIDPDRNFVYGPGSDGQVHKLAVADGSEIIDANWPARSSLKPVVEKAPSPLAIATAQDGSSHVYAVTSSFNEADDYQGHVTAIDLASGSSHVFNAACSDLTIHFVADGTPGVDDCATQGNGIWGRGGATYNPYNGRLYVSVGNGPFDANTGGHDWGDSVLALNPDGTGSGNGLPLDSYTPTEYQHLAIINGDLGSSSPAMLPPVSGSNFPHLGIQLGKDGAVRLLDLDNLSGQGGPGNIGGELQKVELLPGGFGNFATPQPAVWTDVHGDNSVWVIASVQGVMSGLQLTVVNGQPLLESRWTTASMSNSSSPLLANDVVYAVTSGASNATIKAFSATTGATLWTSPTIPGCCHAQSPIVVNGRVYLASGSTLTAFELPAPPPPSPTLSISKSHSGTFAQEQTAVWNLQAVNSAASAVDATDGSTVTVNDTLPAGYTLAGFTGAGWSCSGSNTIACTTNAVVAGGAAFNPIALTVNVPATSPPSVDNVAAVFGGGDVNHSSAGTAAVSNTDSVSVTTKSATSTTLATACPTTFTNGQEFTMTAVVSGSNPTGSSTFRDGGVPIGGCASVPLSNASADCATANLGVGLHDLTAGYGGDAANLSSSSGSLFVRVLDPNDAMFRDGFEEVLGGCPVD